MKKIFISVLAKRPNTTFVSWLKEKLSQFDYTVDTLFFGQHDYATNVFESVQEKIRSCDVFLSILDEITPSSFIELGIAIGCNKEILIIYSPNISLPLSISDFPCIEMNQNDENFLFKIVSKIDKYIEIKGKDNKLVKEYNDILYIVNNMDGLAFERSIIGWIEEMGHKVKLPSPKDYGYDLILEDAESNESLYIEIRKKPQNQKVSILEIEKLIVTMSKIGAKRVRFICSSDFTDSARDLAASAPIKIELWGFEDLVKNGFTGKEKK